MKYEIENQLLTLAEFRQLCESVGWGHIMNFDVAESANGKLKINEKNYG